jgi:phosphatidylglycerophosphatase A
MEGIVAPGECLRCQAVARVVASFFGSGLLVGRMRESDAGSGTVAALLALGIAYLLPPIWGRSAAFVIAAGAGLWAVGQYRFEHDDPGWVVIDEAAGLFLATIGLGLTGMLVAFVVFRVADIGKQFAPGVAAAESLPGAVGIMADDVVAGLYGLGAGWLVQSLLA